MYGVTADSQLTRGGGAEYPSTPGWALSGERGREQRQRVGEENGAANEPRPEDHSEPHRTAVNTQTDGNTRRRR